MDKVDLIFKDARSSERALNKLFVTLPKKKEDTGHCVWVSDVRKHR